MTDPAPKVVLTEHLDDEPADWLAQRTIFVRAPHDDDDALKTHLPGAQGLIVRTYTRVDDKLLAQAPELRVVGRAGVGLDNIDLDACRRRGVAVVYTPDANTQAVVEYVWGLILDVVRPRTPMRRYVPPPIFHDLRAHEVGRQLDRLTLGILGVGRIGRRIAQVAHAVGMRTIYHDLLTHAELNLPDDFTARFVDPDTLYAESDILTIHVDGRASNRHLIGAAALDRLKPDALLINTSRGMVVDADALAAWATRHAGTDATAILDVHDPEPPPDDYPLWNLPNVHLLPHLASRTHEAMANMSWVVRDVWRVLRGEEPAHPAP